jgi:hypothetical protein
VADRVFSSSDSGATWTSAGGPNGVVVCSADGYRVLAGSSSLYTLPYSGLWRLADAPANQWSSVASSLDGTKLVAVPGRGNSICISSNSGATWTPITVPNTRWSCVASSGDGTKLVAAGWLEDPPGDGGDGLICTSTS